MDFFVIDKNKVDSKQIQVVQMSRERLMEEYTMSHRSIQSLSDNTFSIQAHDYVLLANIINIPLIITREKVLIYMIKENASADFASQFHEIYKEIQQTQIHWELAALETLLVFCSGKINDEYVQLIQKFEKYKSILQDHTKMHKQLQSMRSDCEQIKTVLDNLLQNEDELLFLCFDNQDIIFNSNRSNKSSTVSGLTQSANQSHITNRIKKIQSKHQVTNFADLNFPCDLGQLSDLIETYDLQFHNILVEINELDQKMKMKLIETNMQLEASRSYIQNFQITQKMINVAATFSSIIGQFFGMNILNFWRVPDGPLYDRSLTPFMWVSVWTIITLLASFVYLFLGSKKIRMFGVSRSSDQLSLHHIRKGYKASSK